MCFIGCHATSTHAQSHPSSLHETATTPLVPNLTYLCGSIRREGAVLLQSSPLPQRGVARPADGEPRDRHCDDAQVDEHQADDGGRCQFHSSRRGPHDASLIPGRSAITDHRPVQALSDIVRPSPACDGKALRRFRVLVRSQADRSFVRVPGDWCERESGSGAYAAHAGRCSLVGCVTHTRS